MTSDPRDFHDNMLFWLNNTYLQDFPFPPHGAQVYLAADFSPSTDPDVVEWDTVEHDTNAYVSGFTFVIPNKLGGVYTLSVDWEYSAAGTGAGIFVNDIPIAFSDNSLIDTVSIAVTRHLNSGDVVDVRASGNGTIDATGSTTMIPVFNIARIYAINDIPAGGSPPGCDPPVNTVEPVVNDGNTFFSGDTLSVTSNGTWTGTATITFTFQWQNNPGSGFVDIVGATANIEDTTDTSWDGVGGCDPVRVKVTGTNGCGSSSAYSDGIHGFACE
jgi:hypothetical protein